MSYNIGPKIGIDGEAEFRKQLRSINDEYKALEAETKMVAAQFEAMGDEQGKLEAEGKQLIKQISAQQDKMELLEDAVEKASKKYGENSTEATRLKGALYDTQTTIAQLEKRLHENTDELERMASGLDQVEEAAKDADDALEDMDDFSFGDALGADLVAEGVTAIAESIAQAAEETREYRRIMASLDQSSRDAGYSAEETAQLYGKLNGVLGDTQAAATTSANLQALELEQTKLQRITNGVIGAWAKYGDSIPIDGLAEAVNHSAKLGEVQGTLADVIEWGGGTVEAFNERLAACADTTERADLIARLFAEQGLTQMGEAWQEQNDSLMEANAAADAMQRELARLGEMAEPILNGITSAGARMMATINDGLEQLTRKNAGAELASQMNSVAASMTAAQTATHQTAAELESSMFIAGQYMIRLEELEKAGLSTDQAQREYAQTVELLNELVPELNLSISEQTGLLEQDTASILSNLSAWKERAVGQALQKQLTAEIEAQADARAALMTAEQQQIALKAKEQDILRKLEQARAKDSKSTDAWANAMKAGSLAAGGLTGDLSEMGNKLLGIPEDVAVLEEELYACRSEMGELALEMENANGVISQTDEQIRLTEEAVRGYSNALTDTNEKQTTAEQRLEATAKVIGELKQSYADVKAEALTSIKSQIGYFDEMATKNEHSAKKIIENWNAQKKAILEYNDNLQKAVDMGLAPELVEQLSDGSQESMQILDALVNDSEISIDEINEAFGGRLKADEAFSDTLAQLETDFDATMKDLVQKSKHGGKRIVDGLVSAIKGSASNVGDALTEVVGGGHFAVAFDLDGVAASGSTQTSNRLNELEDRPGAMVASGTSTGTRSSNTSYNDFSIQVYQQPGENGEDLAFRVMDVVQLEVERKGAGLNG